MIKKITLSILLSISSSASASNYQGLLDSLIILNQESNYNLQSANRYVSSVEKIISHEEYNHDSHLNKSIIKTLTDKNFPIKKTELIKKIISESYNKNNFKDAEFYSNLVSDYNSSIYDIRLKLNIDYECKISKSAFCYNNEENNINEEEKIDIEALKEHSEFILNQENMSQVGYGTITKALSHGIELNKSKLKMRLLDASVNLKPFAVSSILLLEERGQITQLTDTDIILVEFAMALLEEKKATANDLSVFSERFGKKFNIPADRIKHLLKQRFEKHIQ